MLLDLLDVTRLPCLVDSGPGWAIEAKDGEIAFAKKHGEPVAASGNFAIARPGGTIGNRSGVFVRRKWLALDDSATPELSPA